VSDRSAADDSVAGRLAAPGELTPFVRIGLTVGLLVATAFVLTVGPEPEPGGGVAGATGTPAARGSGPASKSAGGESTYGSPPTYSRPTSAVSAAPSVSSAALRTEATIRAWRSGGVTRAQIVVTVTNLADAAVEFVPSGSRYRVVDRDRHEIASGVFTYAAPDTIEPGGRAYLIETISSIFVSPANVDRVEAVPATRPASRRPLLLETRDVKWRAGPEGGLEATGTVVNTSDRTIEAGFVCVVFFDGAGRVLGGVYDLTSARGLMPAASAGFTTSYPGTPPVPADAVARAEAIAFDLTGPP
jgi:hypothetical protein